MLLHHQSSYTKKHPVSTLKMELSQHFHDTHMVSEVQRDPCMKYVNKPHPLFVVSKLIVAMTTVGCSVVLD